jgi:hypothetical protein
LILARGGAPLTSDLAERLPTTQLAQHRPQLVRPGPHLTSAARDRRAAQAVGFQHVHQCVGLGLVDAQLALHHGRRPERLKDGRFVIPDFQREFEWQPGDIRDLMRSIFLDYYIGSLLLWKGKSENFGALACEPIYGFDGSSGSAEHIVLDGQQRLTAMYYAFAAPEMPAPSRANRYLYFIQVQHFMEMAYDDAFRYDWTRGGLNLLTNTTQQYEDHMFPLSVIGQGGWELPNWVQGYEGLIAENGEPAVRATLETHLISPIAFDILLRDPFTPDDFEAFLAERQRTIQDAIKDLLVNERLDLPPQLRELDAQLEEVELAIRRVITDVLDGDTSRLPSHVQARVRDRLQAAARRNPAIDSDHYETLAGQLEYFDLSELQATIANNALWPAFESRFGTKEILAERFAQLAGLRNCIRHSSAVDEVTRKLGEAATLWFRQVLNK